MAPIRQTSFSAGELSPYLWGRTDMELHGHGLRTLRNFFVTRQGAARSRGGTRFVVQAKTNEVRLLPFVLSDTVSHVLELGDQYLRIHTPFDPGAMVELVTPWRSYQLQALQYAQVGGVLVLTHEAEPAQELRAPASESGGLSTWSLVEARFEPPGDSVTTAQSLTPVFKDKSGNLRLPPMLVQFAAGAADPRAVEAPTDSLFVTDREHPAKEWRWKVSAIMKHIITGEEIETLPVNVVEWFNGYARPTYYIEDSSPGNMVVCYPDKPVLLRHPLFGPTVGALADHANWVPVGSVYYRGRGRLFGFLGQTRYAQDFIDDFAEPNYAHQPLRGDEPAIGNPAAVAFFQQRRAFARSQSLALSATDEWGNHDLPVPPYLSDSAAVQFELYAQRRESVRCLVPMSRLIVLTDASVWSVGGTETALTPSSIEARIVDQVGSEAVMPAVVDGVVVFVRAKGRGVRAVSGDGDGGLQGSDISAHAQHLFTGGDAAAAGGLTRKITQLAYAEDPWGVLWAVREDGVLLSATRSGSTWAWARHDTEGTANVGGSGSYESFVPPGAGSSGAARFVSVVSIPETTEDGVYLAVRRGSATYIERMESRAQMGDAAFDYACVDSCVRYEVAPSTVVFTGLQHLAGREVWITARNNRPFGPFVVSTIGTVTIPEALNANYQAPGDTSEQTLVAYIGLSYSCDLELLDISGPQGTKQKTVTEVGLEVDSAVGFAAGPSLADLTPYRQRRVSDSYGYPSAASELVVIKVGGGWSRSGRAAVRQTLPLPVTVLGVTREVERGEGS